ncbi:MAG: hypothetical protein Q3988_00895 [Gemella sp.]|nr:hypothetical protein [Gemella sp.]
MKTDILKIKKLESIDDVYKETSIYLQKKQIITDASKLFEDLKLREQLGIVKIYEDFYLPHLITDNALENIVLRVDGFNEKVLFILLKENHEKDKEKAFRLVGKLLDSMFVEEMFKANKKDLEIMIENI